MITIFEDFENIDSEPQIGDWVICTVPSYVVNNGLKEVLNNKIGKLIGKNNVYWRDDGEFVRNSKVLIEYPERLPEDSRNVLKYSARYKNFNYYELIKNKNIKLNIDNIDNCIWVDDYYITSHDKDRIVLEVKFDKIDYNL